MDTSQIRKAKQQANKYPPTVLRNQIMDYLHCSPEKITSASLAGDIRHMRKVLFYLMFMHTNLTFINIRNMFYVPESWIRQALHEARKDSANKKSRFYHDANEIISQINNTL